MSTPNDDEKANKKELSATESAIIELLKQANVKEASADQVRQMLESQASDGSGRRHAFWDTQPMRSDDADGDDVKEGPIEPDKKLEDIRAEPYNMPKGFEWSTIDVTNDDERMELYTLLANNYVEDDDCHFRFDYSHEFLKWALTPPGYLTDLLLGVRASTSKKLVAFISGVPATIHASDNKDVTPSLKVVEINFLCVHKKLRSKRLAPVLIKEITRRVNRTGVFQAVYTGGIVLPGPVSSARYYHRSLNPKKLVEIGFSRLSPRLTMARMIKMYKVATKPACAALQPMKEEHVPGVTKLLSTYLSKFPLHIQMEDHEVAHWLLPRKQVIDSFVVVNEESGEVTDMCSFYHLPSSVLTKGQTLYAAYAYYNVATSMPLVELVRDALVLANNAGSDVYNALNLMDNKTFLEELKFGKGDGNLQYYIYNWSSPMRQPEEVGIVLL